MKRLAIIGSRNFPSPHLVRDLIEDLRGRCMVITGGWWDRANGITPTRGVDAIAAQAARARGLIVAVVAADFDRYGKAAGLKRNPTIVDSGDYVIAFWDGESKDTAHGIEYARKQYKPLRIIRPCGREIVEREQLELFS